MSDPIDPARVGIQLDRAEEAGLIETDVAEWLRGLVRADSEWREKVRVAEEKGPVYAMFAKHSR